MSVVDQGAIDLAMTVGKRFAALLAEQQMADARPARRQRPAARRAG